MNSIYSVLSTLIVHIYGLHITTPSPSRDQITRISVCMYALDKVSEVWLIATAVQALFESVLTSSGYDKQVEEASGYRFGKRLEEGESMKDDDKSAEASGKALTPALREWASVTLKATVPPPLSKNQPEQYSVSKKPTEDGIEPVIFSTEWKELSQEAPYHGSLPLGQVTEIPADDEFEPMLDYLPEDQNASWSPRLINGTPPPTGFSVAEWYVSCFRSMSSNMYSY